MSCLACDKQAIYGLPDTVPMVCEDHYSAEMLDLRHVKCIYCDKRPTHSFPYKPWTHCKAHALIGMKTRYIKRMLVIDQDGRYYRSKTHCEEASKIRMQKREQKDYEYNLATYRQNRIAAYDERTKSCMSDLEARSGLVNQFLRNMEQAVVLNELIDYYFKQPVVQPEYVEQPILVEIPPLFDVEVPTEKTSLESEFGYISGI